MTTPSQLIAKRMTPEDQAAFEQHCAGIRESLAPAGAFESDLAQAIAEDRWRLNRARAIENGIFALGETAGTGDGAAAGLAPARTWLAEGRSLQLLTIYEQRIHRSIERAFAQLTKLQEKREAAQKKALEEAQLLAQFDHMRGVPYDPAVDLPAELPVTGSAFSAAAVMQALNRSHRLELAQFYSRRLWDPKVVCLKPDLRLPRAA